MEQAYTRRGYQSHWKFGSGLKHERSTIETVNSDLIFLQETKD